jgi:hypothetical protein
VRNTRGEFHPQLHRIRPSPFQSFTLLWFLCFLKRIDQSKTVAGFRFWEKLIRSKEHKRLV